MGKQLIQMVYGWCDPEIMVLVIRGIIRKIKSLKPTL